VSRGSEAARPRVLVVSDWYLPGRSGGGTVRSLVNLFDWLGDEFEFLVAARDREPGDGRAFPGVRSGDWQPVGKARVFYRPPRGGGLRFWRGFLATTPHDVLYLNSCFATSVVQILLLRRLGLVPARPTVLAPRGVLTPGALGLKRGKKTMYLMLARFVGLHRNVTWHATGEDEARNILTWFPERRAAAPQGGQERQVRPDATSIVVAANLPSKTPAKSRNSVRPPKVPGEAKIVFLSRIDRKKNLDVAITLVAGAKGRASLDIWGPVSDGRYWQECKRLIAKLPLGVTATYRGIVEPGDVTEVFSTNHLFLFPTRGENFGHVILEALCAGCPVLVSDQTPWRNLEEQGVGWEFPLAELDRFRAALNEVVEMGDAEFQQRACKAEAFGRAIASDPRAMDATRAILRQACGLG
jgi:glycosyltransferase involved in cell wall biosynthesis